MDTTKQEENKIKLPEFDPSLFFGSDKKVSSNPKDILKEIGVEENNVVADFGAGIGFFVMEIAKIVGSSGKVIAVDIDKNLLDSLKNKSIESGLKNIYGVVADLEIPGSTKIKDNSCDVVLIINVLYLIKKRQEVINEAYRILKKGGKLAVMDWKEKGIHTVIEKEQIISAKDIKKIGEKAGFIYKRVFEAGLSHEISEFVK